MKRLFRSVFLAAVVAAGVAAVKALTRKDDPLPAPAAPTGGPWPPLQNESAPPTPAPSSPASAPAKATPAPKPATPAEPEKSTAKKAPAKKATTRAKPPEAAPAAAVSPEPDGVPVADAGDDAPAEGWVDNVDGECPPGYPIKANMNSKIFHSPGQLNYDRTHPDRCYASAEAAEADGLRAAKR